jgi:hypothetical protein
LFEIFFAIINRQYTGYSGASSCVFVSHNVLNLGQPMR